MDVNIEKGIIIGIVIIFIALVLVVFPVSLGKQPTQLQTNSQASPLLSQNIAQNAGGDCGDLNDIKNIQHLSHHPDKADCIRKVNPQKFKEATGQDKSAFIG